MRKLKYEVLLEKAENDQKELMEITNYDEQVYQSYSELINDLGEKASLEAEIFHNEYLKFDEFVEDLTNYMYNQLSQTDLGSKSKDLILIGLKSKYEELYKKFDKIQIEELYKLVDEPIEYEEEFDPMFKFIESEGL